MADEHVAPSRAEIDAWLWAYKKHNATEDQLTSDVQEWLSQRGVSPTGIATVLTDLHTYSNYPVEEDNAVS